jgi:hypothetical protein
MKQFPIFIDIERPPNFPDAEGEGLSVLLVLAFSQPIDRQSRTGSRMKIES